MGLSLQGLIELERERLEELRQNRYVPLSDEAEPYCRQRAVKLWNLIFAGTVISPVPPYLLIRDVPLGEEVRESGIILPASKREQDLAKALVMAIPKGGIPVRNKLGKELGVRKCIVEQGNLILYEKFRGVDILVKGEPFVLLDEICVVAVLD